MTSSSPARVTYRQVLAVREFQALLLSQGFSLLGDQVTRIAVALLVYERSGSAFAASATYACSYLTWLLGGPLLSAVADRCPRRTVMVVCDLVRAGLVALLLVPGLPLAGVFAVLVVAGLLAPPFDSARSAVLPDVLDDDAFPVGNGIMSMLMQVGQGAGFLLGGVLVAAVGTRGALLVDVATFLLSAVAVALVLERRDAAVGAADRGTLLGDATQGLTAVRRHPTLRWLLAWGVLGSAAVIAPEGLAVAVADGRGDGATAAGVLTASVPVGFLLGSVLLLRLVPADARLRLLPALAVASCLPLLLTPWVGTTAGIAALWVLAGAGSVLQLVASTAYVAATPPALRARAYGVAVTALMAVQGAVLLLAGAAAEHVDPRAVVAAAAGAALLLVPLARRLAPEQAAGAQALAATGREFSG